MTMRKINPVFLLGCILVIVAAVMYGITHTPEKTPEIVGFCTLIMGVLITMLQNSQLDRKIDESDKKTDALDKKIGDAAKDVKDDVKSAVFKQGEQVARVLVQTDKVKDDKLDTIIKQTNGDLKKSLDAMKDELKQEIAQVKPPTPAP